MESILKLFDLTVTDGKMIVVSSVLFFIFWRLVHHVIFTPFLALHEEREKLTTGAVESSRAELEKAVEMAHAYQKEIDAVRVQAVQEKMAKVQEAKVEANKRVGASERSAQRLVTEARAQNEKDISVFHSTEGKKVEAFARSIVDKLKNPKTYSSTGGEV